MDLSTATSTAPPPPLPELDLAWLTETLNGLGGPPPPVSVSQLVSDFKAGLLRIANDTSHDLVQRHLAMEWCIETDLSEAAIAARKVEREIKACAVYNVRVMPLLPPPAPPGANQNKLLQERIVHLERQHFYSTDVCHVSFDAWNAHYACVHSWPMRYKQVLENVLQQQARFLLSTPGGVILQVKYNLTLPMKIQKSGNCTYYSARGIPKQTSPKGIRTGRMEFSLTAARLAATTLDLGIIMQSFQEVAVRNSTL